MTTSNTLTRSTHTPSIVIERGKRAYQQIKTDAQAMREKWRMVGEALLVGRRENPSNKAFGDWCREQGFDMRPEVRSNAMWLAENWHAVLCSTQDECCTPTEIRRAFNESQKAAELPEELQSITPEPSIELDKRSAERVAKVLRHARNGEGTEAETAKRHVESLAKKHGTTVEQLEKAVARTVPKLYHRLTPKQITVVEAMEELFRDTAQAMINDGLPAQAMKDIFIAFAHSLHGESS